MYLTTIGYHDANFELEIVIDTNAVTEEDARIIGNKKEHHIATLYENKIIINNEIVINKSDYLKYQFRICLSNKFMVSYIDYQDINWISAMTYLKNRNLELPFKLESYYCGIYENAKNLNDVNLIEAQNVEEQIPEEDEKKIQEILAKLINNK